jgi:rubrerythrin
MYTSQYSQAVEERLTRRLAIEQAKGDGASAAIVRETKEAIEGQYCPDCAVFDDGAEHRCPTCGRQTQG